MALINCAECGKQISDKAAACPNCGAPVAGLAPVKLDETSHARVTRTGAKWEGLGFVLIIVGLVTAVAAEGAPRAIGTLAVLVGFVVFIIGRFL